ncbi:MAG: hypothetical protein COX65_09100 [Elusimicrobia bacterium CG_4_10_14_0_2_um_filter_56_8]|nr:MAG: hypothetical protein AUJ51_02255 [Elusimicrobia bacterium CG1_02_56_21]PJA12067.1 MAG: hypothetical protein COX65_09100 [Elusimicrobia bacterium CG_4_10_14_0_2_um_filter_56_8]
MFTFSASPVFAFDLQSVNAAGIKELEPVATVAAAPVPAADKAASRHLWMSVRNNPSFKEAQANDWGARIEARVRESFPGSFDVNLRTDSDFSWASVRKSGNSYYTLSGSGIYLSMSGSGGSYFLNGTVAENGKTTQVSVNLSKRFDDFSFNVFGSGLNLYTDQSSMSGSFDSDRFSKKAVAAVTSMLLALQVEKGQPKQEQKSANYNQSIWLTIGPGFGWDTVEARDPFARIEVNLRKIFDKEYDAEIVAGNNRQWGRVSGFFSRRHELRAGRTDLRMEEWAGRWEIRGSVEADRPGQQQAVNLEMRERFYGDHSFYIQEEGIRLNIDRRGISGDIDTRLYPREVVGAITSLVMAYYQDTPQQPR